MLKHTYFSYIFPLKYAQTINAKVQDEERVLHNGFLTAMVVFIIHICNTWLPSESINEACFFFSMLRISSCGKYWVSFLLFLENQSQICLKCTNVDVKEILCLNSKASYLLRIFPFIIFKYHLSFIDFTIYFNAIAFNFIFAKY